jgi:hypothetical protein
MWTLFPIEKNRFKNFNEWINQKIYKWHVEIKIW